MTKAKTTETQGVSIGAVSRETGIGIETLRMWERRYGLPLSFRLPSGHRRYPEAEIARLRLAAEAMGQGFRAGEVAAASVEELNLMLARGRRRYLSATPEERRAETAALVEGDEIDAWLEATLNYDDEALSERLRQDWSRLGAMRFLAERAVPFLERVGQNWRDGELAVSHEHFASEKLGDFLSAQWRLLNEGGATPAVLLASLPGDLHRLGLQMCALAAALGERKVLYIGQQTPPSEIVRTAEAHRPAAVCLSISETMDSVVVARTLRQLRLELPSQVPLVVGGKGAPSGIEGVLRITDLNDFQRWVRTID